MEWIHWLKVPSVQSQNSVTGFMSLSLATWISIHNLSQTVDGGDHGLSVCNAAYLFRAGSVSIPSLIQILNTIVDFWCYRITNAVLRMVMIASSPSLNEQCKNKWALSNWEPGSCRLMWEYLFCRTSTASFYVIHCLAKWAGSTGNDEAWVLDISPVTSLGPHKHLVLPCVW